MSPDDDDLLGELGRALGHDPDREPPPERVAALRAAAERLSTGSATPMPAAPRDGGCCSRAVSPQEWVVFAGYLARDLATPAEPPAAPVEAISLQATPGVTATGGLINHTWGTELLLDVTGLEAGATYVVDYRLADGSTVTAGSLLGVADVVMRCRFNAARCAPRYAASWCATSTGEWQSRASCRSSVRAPPRPRGDRSAGVTLPVGPRRGRP